MPQETINIILAILTPLFLFAQFLLTKYFSRGKDTAEYSGELLKLANDATEALRKAREELNIMEDIHEKTLMQVREANEATIKSIRTEYDARHQRLKARILDLENVQRIYKISFDLLTHPNIEVKNITATSVDDTTASQKLRAVDLNPPSSESHN
jgi:hypothetical protein